MLAVHPADLAPPPAPFPFAMDRERGIEASQALITAEEYQARLNRGETDGLAHVYLGGGEVPVIRVEVLKVTALPEDVTLYELASLDGTSLPAWEPGAHLDIVVAPEFFRQHSLCGDPADRSRYRVAVLREEAVRVEADA